MTSYYKQDLAYIHHVGFAEFALKSAPGIIGEFQKNSLKSGLIVDLGCGSGLSAQQFIKANYQVLGIDISESMIEIARQEVPKAQFKVESLFKAKIPPCVAVTSIGECLNYLFDLDNNSQGLTSLFNRIHQALIPGGLFIFDILEPLATAKTQGFRAVEDWIVLFEKEEHREQKKLTRRIITLRKEEQFYKRDDEIHHLWLYEASEIVDKLHKIGFKVEIKNNYGQFYLPKGHTVFIARKLLNR